MDRPDQRRRNTLLIVIGLVVVIVVVVLGLRRIERDVQEAHQLRIVNRLLVDYVCRHQSWPDRWEALVPIAEATSPGTGALAIDDLREVVGIHWNLDLPALLATGPNDDRSRFSTTYRLRRSDLQWMGPTEEIYSGIVEQCPGIVGEP